jgi:putative sterol carrier protein
MAKFLSEEWMQLYIDEWNKKELVNDLKGFTASVKHFIEGKEDEAVELIVENGVAKSAGKADNKKYDFEMWATYDNWKILAKGEMGPKAAMLTKN